MSDKSQNYKDVFEKSNILNNKTNSQNMSSAKKNEEESNGKKILDGASKVRQWHKGLQSQSGWERLQTGADIAKTIMTGM